jgi:hypothetical protein
MIELCNGYGKRVVLNADGRGTCPLCGAIAKVFSVKVPVDFKFKRDRKFHAPHGRINRHPPLERKGTDGPAV